MSPVHKTPDGKWQMDWTALIVLLITIGLSAGSTAFATYAAFREKLGQHDVRLKSVEDWKTGCDRTLNEHIAGYSGDRVTQDHTKETLQEVKDQVKELRMIVLEIRADQVRRYKLEKTVK
jgi:hypothetical protein